MPARWVINPVVTVGGARMPKVATLADPGRPKKAGGASPTYQHTSIISDGIGRPGERDDIALSLVFGADLSALDADPEIENLLEDEFVSILDAQRALDETPLERGWNAAKFARVMQKVNARANGTPPLDRVSSKLADVLHAVAYGIHARHSGVREMRTTGRVN